MKRKLSRGIAFGALMVGFVGSASAGVIFHNSATFPGAVSGLQSLGLEDFEASTLAPNNITTFNDPLTPGVANGPFPANWQTPNVGLTVQSNAAGGVSTNPSPQGLNGLATASVGFFGTPDDQVTANFPQHSLDLIFNSPVPEPIVAVGLVPLFVDSVNFPVLQGNVRVDVYNTANVFLGSQTVLADYVAEIAFLGIEATGTDDIGRINLWDLDGVNHFQGADDIDVYAAPQPTVPEPATLALLGLGLAGVGVRRRWR